MSMYRADQLFGYIATILAEAQDLQTPQDVAKLLHSRLYETFAARGEEFRIIIVESAREVLGYIKKELCPKCCVPVEGNQSTSDNCPTDVRNLRVLRTSEIVGIRGLVGLRLPMITNQWQTKRGNSFLIIVSPRLNCAYREA
jgi:hypothetical protein